MLVIQNQPHGSLAHFRRKFVRCLAHDGSTFAGVGASGKPGAVQELFINSVRTVPIEGLSVAPTAVRYHQNGFSVGHAAYEDETEGVLVNDFKLGLGNGEYSQLQKRTVTTFGDGKRSVVGVTQDFVTTTLKRVTQWSEQNGLAAPSHILVAEPLALEGAAVAGKSWLANYRSNIRRILHNFEKVDFLPEPFAVFQYYRYGLRHPLIAAQQKHVALVLDFGGGTFDVSIIETTAQGDISQSGRNQRPLSAKSVAAGGFLINLKIAEYLIYKADEALQKNKAARRAIEMYEAGKWQSRDPSINPEVYTFLENFDALVRRAEKAKIAICTSISNWDLEANLGSKVPVRVKVPLRPFSPKPQFAEISLDAAELKALFEKEVWLKRLKNAISEVVRRAASDLEGTPISVVLLSGGSSNIGWLKRLIERDLDFLQLKNTEIIDLAEDYQEIVSKGLAVECARRYYTEGEGDFQAVLYNKLCLLLAPNGRDTELRRFRVIVPGDLIGATEDAVLLPSASSLRSRFDQDLRWKVKLSTSPNRELGYHFMRSSFDPEDVEGQLNVVQKTVTTPREAVFGQAIEVSLTVRADGTAEPRFIYGRGRGDKETVVEGMPFFMDMTSSINAPDVSSYIGFDFGTSTSSFSLVSKNEVNVYRERANDRNWSELSELIAVLPYPVAAHLARYLGETHAEALFKRGRAAFEAALTYLSYLAYTNYLRHKGRQNSALFRGLAHRSAGPLWSLLQTSTLKTSTAGSIPSLAKLLE